MGHTFRLAAPFFALALASCGGLKTTFGVDGGIATPDTGSIVADAGNCGSAGEPCCSNSSCGAGLVCESNVCVATVAGSSDSGSGDAGDVCATANGGCSATAVCISTGGGVACECPPGYVGNGQFGGALNCTNPCTIDNGGCSASAVCELSSGVVVCGCPAGYASNGQQGGSLACTSLCSINNGGCGTESTCSLDGGSVSCSGGPDGGESDAGNTCTVDNGGCSASALCDSSSGSVTCECPAGFTGNGKPGTKLDCTSPCATGNGGCNTMSTCSVDGGAVVCQCDPGYVSSGSGTTLTCSSPCGTLNGGCSTGAICYFSNGAVSCGCPAGYISNGQFGSSLICTNPCSINNGGCGPGAVCALSGDGVACSGGSDAGAVDGGQPDASMGTDGGSITTVTNQGLVLCNESGGCPPLQFCCGGGPDGGGVCTDFNWDPRNCGTCGNACSAGAPCEQGRCEGTQPGYCVNVSNPPVVITCGGTCVDTATDPSNCGGCGIVCPSGLCDGTGHCADSCAAGGTVCLGTCVDLQTDNNNCGGCNVFCQTDTQGERCVNGACKCTSNPDQPNLCGSGSATICTSLQSDPLNCGQCGFACALGTACVSGQCPAGGGTNTSGPNNMGLVSCVHDGQCPTGEACCDGACTDRNLDNQNCGGCGNSCGGQSCQSGQCQGNNECLMFAEPALACGEACVDPYTDPFNCGTCGTVCADGICDGQGHCGAACAPGFTSCQGVCVDIRTDPNNCGGCNEFCVPQSRTSCLNGACVCPPYNPADVNISPAPDLCGTGLSEFCTYLMTDDANCGSCGHACTHGQTCNGAGVCTSPVPDGGYDACLSACPSTCSTPGEFCFSDGKSYCTPCAGACYGATTVTCP